jgi:FkbM family methyltransferase
MTKYFRSYKFYLSHLLFKAGLLKYINFTASKTLSSKKYIIPVINCAGFTNLSENYEPWFSNFLQKILISSRPYIIDVGVNIGQTILKLATLNKDVYYLGFEPNPTCYSYSRKLIQANSLTNYKIFPVGLSDKFQVLSLFGDNDYAAGASLIGNFRKNVKRYSNIQNVAVAEGDKILAEENLPQIDFIKADVEGAELEVMKGLPETIAKYQPLIMLEILPVYSLDNENGVQRKTRQDELLAVMKNYGYQCYLVDEKKCMLNPINSIPVHSDMGRTNYFFIPLQKIKAYSFLVQV